MTTSIVVDLGFGDSGKGSFVDYLCRKSIDANKSAVVVRYGGSNQCGHNVVTPEGLHHEFHIFGSGTLVPKNNFYFVETYLSEHVLVDLQRLQVEAEVIVQKTTLPLTDAYDMIFMHEDCKLILPFHIAINRLLEMEMHSHGSSRGTCGAGVGVAMGFFANYPHLAITAKDLQSPESRQKALVKMFALQTYLYREHEGLIKKWLGNAELFPGNQSIGLIKDCFGSEKPQEIMQYCMGVMNLLSSVAENVAIYNEETIVEILRLVDDLIFEGHQGVLLDENYGFNPYTTYATTTDHNARKIIDKLGRTDEVHCYGLMRSYMTRHGAGPFPSEDPNIGILINANEHNPYNPWQGSMRTGCLDVRLLQYATDVMEKRPDSLVITCVDQGFQADLRDITCLHEDVASSHFPSSDEPKVAYWKSFDLTGKLYNTNPVNITWTHPGGAHPHLSPMQKYGIKLAQTVEEYLEVKVSHLSFGPKATDKFEFDVLVDEMYHAVNQS